VEIGENGRGEKVVAGKDERKEEKGGKQGKVLRGRLSSRLRLNVQNLSITFVIPPAGGSKKTDGEKKSRSGVGREDRKPQTIFVQGETLGTFPDLSKIFLAEKTAQPRSREKKLVT